MKNVNEMQNPVPVFFAADENYMPFLGVTLASMKKYSDKTRTYHVHVLYTGTLGENARQVAQMQTENISVQFDDVSTPFEKIKRSIHCRDYYTGAIYFRLFIPELFPQYEKAVYLDCDIVLLDDVAKLYDMPLNGNYIGAVADQVVANIPNFADYTRCALGIEAKKYFNSGVISMDLEQLRKMRFCQKFAKMLDSYAFIVAPDQDCLNLICKNKVQYFPAEWNLMPMGGKRGKPKLIHYNLSMKPWHYDGVLFADCFWDMAKQTPFYNCICQKKAAFTPEMAKKDEQDGARLLALAQAEADSPYNYIRTVGGERINKQNEGGMYGFNKRIGAKTDVAFAD